MRVPKLFNGPVEAGLRALVLLVEAFPQGLDLQRLVTLDYLVVHSGDVEAGPASLHPPSPLRAGEVAVRRALIESGLHLYSHHGLLRRVAGPEGILYFAEETSSVFLDAALSEYVANLRTRAQWAFERFGMGSVEQLEAVLAESMGRWRVEFAVLGGDEEGA